MLGGMMKKLGHTNRLAVAAALTTAIFYILFSIVALIAPDYLVRMIESWHYLPMMGNLKLHVTLMDFIRGLLGHTISVYLIVAVWDKIFHSLEK